jgi:hypothetical protein
MEAATPLRKTSVRTVGDRVVAEGLVVTDDCTVRLVREREEAGGDAAQLLVDAIEIGARVLDREQAGANAEFVRSEFDKVSREVEHAFTERARQVAETLGKKVDEAFGPESGHVTRALERHFSDGSSTAVQNRVKEVVAEVMSKSREDLVRQFSSADAQNPLAEFKSGVVRALNAADQRQTNTLRGLDDKLAELQKEVGSLRAERDKLAEVEAERERGTAKGRTFEELVADAVDRLAGVQGDDSEAVGDQKGATGKTGDVVVAIDGCNGPARGRIVFEAKNRKLSRPDALRELDKARRDRDADFAVLVVPSEEKIPARMRPLREYNGDKMIVTFDPESEQELALEVGYSLARSRVLMRRSESDGVDAAAVHATIERALNALENVRGVKQQLTGAKTNIDKARDLVESLAEQVRAHLRDIAELVEADEDGDADSPEASQRSLIS